MKLPSPLNCILPLVLAPLLSAQPYHTDTTVGGTQTLEVEGDLSVKQYGGGFGGDLSVTGEAHLGKGALSLLGLPSGVTGVFYGPVKLGGSSNLVEYKFSKTGDDSSGDFIVPLGRFGDWEGTLLDFDILSGPVDSDSGAAHFKLMSKRHQGNGQVTAVYHSAFGGGIGVKLHALNTHGVTHMFLEFDATSMYNSVQDHWVVVRVVTTGSCDPSNRETVFSQMSPVAIASSIRSNAIWGDDLTQAFNAANLVLNGNVAVASGKTLTVDGSPVMTSAMASAFVPKGNASGGILAGGSATASGPYSIAMGLSGTTATGSYSYASGPGATASGFNSVARGFGTIASGSYSQAIGNGVVASGNFSSARGPQAKATGEYSLASGHYVQANSFGEVALGSANLTLLGAATSWDPLDYLFHVGNGTADASRSDALTILKNGKTTLTNKDWKADYAANSSSALADPGSASDSGGTALEVDGHTILNGKVQISHPQGDISMGAYQ